MSAIEARRAALELQSELLELDAEDVELDFTTVKRPNSVDGELENIEVATLSILFEGYRFTVTIDSAGSVYGQGGDLWGSAFSGARALAFGLGSESWSAPHTAEYIMKRLPSCVARRVEQSKLLSKFKLLRK